MKTIPLCVPYLSGFEAQYVQECLNSGWIATSGPFISRFEEAVANFTTSPYAVGVASGTAALHLALLVAGVAPEDEVLVPTLTFIAPVNCIHYARAHPVFMDIDPKTWQLDVKKVERFLREECFVEKGICFNRKTKRRVQAILVVHLLGLCAEIDALASLAKEFGLKLIEDAAEGLGVRYKEKHVGTFGDVGALSFNANKLVTAGSGGMVLTKDKRMAERVRYLSTQAKDEPHEFFHSDIGFNYRLTNIHAALGLAQMEEVEQRINKKRAIASFYDEVLKDIANVTRMSPIPNCFATYWLYTFLLSNMESRKPLLQALYQEGILARSLFHPVHQLPLYREAQNYQMEHACGIYERGICLPSSLSLNNEELTRVAKVLKQFLKKPHHLHADKMSAVQTVQVVGKETFNNVK